MSVVWRRLTVTGFGRFEHATSVAFHQGLNVLVAPNESGKSTLAAALAAVLFGLPASPEADGFSQSRWRHWREPARFEGELVFAAAGKTYRIRRRFADHAVVVSEETPEGWRDVLSGTHNPQARRRNERYETFLAETIGIVDAKLFMQTFSVTQPLPAVRELDAKVQQLISGAGSAQVDVALGSLAQQAKSLTKRTGELGLTPRDGVKEGELEALEQRIAELQAAVEASRQAVDERQSVQEQLADLQEEMRRLQGELERVDADVDAWTQWQKLRDEHRRALLEQSQLERAWATYVRRAEELEAQRRRIAEQYPEMSQAPAGTGQLLEELQRLQEEQAAKRGQLRSELAALQRRAGELAAEWDEYAARRERWRGAVGRLRAEFGVFEEADEATLRLCATYTAAKSALELKVEQARRELAAARTAQAQLEAERARFREAYGDLEGLEDDAVTAVDVQVGRLEEKGRLETELARARARHRRTRMWQIGLASTIAVAMMIVAFGAYPDGWPLRDAIRAGLVGAGLLLVVLTMTIPRLRTSPEVEELSGMLRDLQAALAAETRLGPFQKASLHELGALKQRLLARRQAAASLEERAAAVPGGLEDLAERRQQAEDEYARFMEATEPARARFGEQVEEAYRRWLALRQEAAQLRDSLLAFTRRHFGHETLEPERLAVDDLLGEGVPGAWRAAARLAATAGLLEHGEQGSARIGDLAAALPRLAEASLDALAQAQERGQAEFAQAQKPLDGLMQRLQALLAAANGDAAAARRRWETYQRQLAAADGLEKELAGVLAGQGVSSAEDLHVRARSAANVAMDAYRRLQELTEQHPSLPRAEDALEGADARLELQRLAARRDELKRIQKETEERLLALRWQLAELSGRNVINVATALDELQGLLRRREELAREVRVVALAYRELRAAADAFRETHRDRLAQRATFYVQRFSGRARRVVLDEQFRIAVQDPDGPLHGVGQLSQGAQDQLYLALRLAVADLVAREVRLPLLLDDPFVNCDEQRLERIRAALAEVASQRQVVLLTHRDTFLEWGTPVALLPVEADP